MFGMSKKDPYEMGLEELSAEFHGLRRKVDFLNKRLPYMAGGVGVTGLIVAGILLLTGVPGAVMAVVGGISGGSMVLGLGSMPRDEFQMRMTSLSYANDAKIKCLKAQNERAEKEQALQRDRETRERELKDAVALREEFSRALNTIENGIPSGMKVKGPLKLKRQASSKGALA